jgi:class 3 adenylate cyclase/tetratricopeptide (TPR) repeat protein
LTISAGIAIRFAPPSSNSEKMVHMGGVAIVMFSDLVDSTALLASLGDDRMERVRRAHLEQVRQSVDRAGGRVVKTLGDGVMASFDSALGALRAAAAIQDSVERLDAANDGVGLAARVGVAAGEPIADGDDLHGMAVVISSRLSSAAGTGEVLVQDLVQALVASRDGVALEEPRDYELKGVPAPVRAANLRWRELVPAPVDDAETGPGAPSGKGARLPPILAAFAEEPLIGRDREISELREAAAPREGRRAVVILGEPGIGKTRHAAAAAAEAHQGGATVVLARCPPEVVVPFEPWVRAIGELALAGDPAWSATLARAAGPDLSALVPELGEHSTAVESAEAGTMVAAEGARYRLLRGIGAALSCAAGDAPLHVLLDDAHWCDAASAQALGHLLDSAPPQLVLVVTARDREMGHRHPVSRVLADLRRTGDLHELRLDGLDAPGVAALVDARMGRAITPGLATRLQARTAGNPFFAGELMRELDGRGALVEGEALDSAPVPDAVSELVAERLARLDPDTERLLVAAAAIGPSAAVALAAEVAGLSAEEAERAVRQALSERLVDEVPAPRPTIAFPHALVREALSAGAGDAASARLHLAIARALEKDQEAETAGELARHFGLAVPVAGPEPAIAAYSAAATAAAEGHDHEQAASHLRSILSLVPEEDRAARAPVLLELGEQELLSADLSRARGSYRAAIEAARATDDPVTLACAALGFAGGDVGFGWETGADDPAAVEQLREGLDALGESEPLLALRMTSRLALLLLYSDDDEALAELDRRAGFLAGRVDSPEARLLRRLTALGAQAARGSEMPPQIPTFAEEALSLVELAERCGREDLLFRVVQWSAVANYVSGRIPECEAAVERAAEIAQRLGSPRFTWEVDMNRAMRLLDRGDPAGATLLRRRAGSVGRLLRPDIGFAAELVGAMLEEWYYDSETAAQPAVYEAISKVVPGGFLAASLAGARAIDGDHAGAGRQMRAMLGDGDDLEGLRRPDIHMPATIVMLAYTASLIGDRKAGRLLRPLLEPMRSCLVLPVPGLGAGQLAEWHIGRLELLDERLEAAVDELRFAVARADELEIVWAGAMVRVDLATALHRRGNPGDPAEAEAVLSTGEDVADRYGVGWAIRCAAETRREIEGRETMPGSRAEERSRPLRTLAARGGRRALTAMVAGLDDEAVERRFAEPRRQRALMRAMARSFQPSKAGGFSGTVAYELEPQTSAPAPGAPWRWAIAVDSKRGRARLVEPAPLDATVTVYFGLADWVRVMTGALDPIAAMTAGRCTVLGDVRLAVRLEGMFGVQ